MSARSIGLIALAMLAALPGSAFAGSLEQDRAAILAMAGDYKVTFDFRETVSFVPDYTPREPKRSGGNEIVRVISDTGDKIVLQHLLVAEGKDGKAIVVKHWRHDWAYEPQTILEYSGTGRWDVRDTSRAERKSHWSETVWQTDDSPRYGAIGVWRHENGISEFTTAMMKRPLPRRDALKHPPYSWFESVEHYIETPTGWVQEEANAKLGIKDGKTVTFVHESGVNTYDRFADFQIAAAENYWKKSADFWAGVRTAWADAARDRTVRVIDINADTIPANARLMDLAEDVVSGKIQTPAALDEARTLIHAGDSARGNTASLK